MSAASRRIGEMETADETPPLPDPLVLCEVLNGDIAPTQDGQHLLMRVEKEQGPIPVFRQIRGKFRLTDNPGVK
jgi:hypothetical protein